MAFEPPANLVQASFCNVYRPTLSLPQSRMASGRLRLHLNPMPLLDLISQHTVDQPMLFDDGQAFKLLRDDIKSVH